MTRIPFSIRFVMSLILGQPRQDLGSPRRPPEARRPGKRPRTRLTIMEAARTENPSIWPSISKYYSLVNTT